MEIKDAGDLTSFETVPTEQTLYLTAIKYNSGSWTGGPSSTNKEEVVKQLENWTGVIHARIYSVKVPLRNLPSS